MAGVTKVHDALKSKQDEVDHEMAEFIPKRIAKKGAAGILSIHPIRGTA